MIARYDGVCTRGGQSYAAGTSIVKGAKGWEIAPGSIAKGSAEFREILRSDGSVTKTDINADLVCGACIKARPTFDAEMAEVKASIGRTGGAVPTHREWEQYRLQRVDETLLCAVCGHTLQILPKSTPRNAAAETKQCWECGCVFTYAQCRRAGGDWSDSYCGC